MIHRQLWLERIEASWRRRPIVWLSGPRRVGKTSLARMLDGTEYVNCDLPSAARRLSDPEAFYRSAPPGSTIILDEVHRLPDPSLVLKIASDAFPHLRILATGSSTLAATRKFRDALTGRKETIYLSPVLWDECRGPFGVPSLDGRLLRGGLPEQLLAPEADATFFAEWLDSFYARDISELFGVRNRTGFMALLHMLLRQSGGILDIGKLASEAGLSRPTVGSHLEALSVAHAVYQVRPYSAGGRREFVGRSKVYAFDTGVISFVRGWSQIRDEDRGGLWEHLVLDTLRAAHPAARIGYWRDTTGHEVDFVVSMAGGAAEAVECKISPDRISGHGFGAFRARYPQGGNWAVCPYQDTEWTTTADGMPVTAIGTQHLLDGALGRLFQPGAQRDTV
ncbi:MAG: DUF4143 domain-containing protein [Armatimonadetes bacterium]|nr:DUF4143 domain-containing protein [Armatimonadota bacterium]